MRTIKAQLTAAAARVGPWLKQTSTRTAILTMLGIGVAYIDGGSTKAAAEAAAGGVVFGLVFNDVGERRAAENLLAALLKARAA